MWVCLLQQLFFSYFKELVGKVVTVELKNDLAITGILHSVDQYLNIKLEDTRVVDEAKYPHMVRTFSSTSRVFVVRPLLFFFFLFRLCFVIFIGFCTVNKSASTDSFCIFHIPLALCNFLGFCTVNKS